MLLLEYQAYEKLTLFRSCKIYRTILSLFFLLYSL